MSHGKCTSNGKIQGKEKREDPCLSGQTPLNKINRKERCKMRYWSGLRKDEELSNKYLSSIHTVGLFCSPYIHGTSHMVLEGISVNSSERLFNNYYCIQKFQVTLIICAL